MAIGYNKAPAIIDRGVCVSVFSRSPAKQNAQEKQSGLIDSQIGPHALTLGRLDAPLRKPL